MAVRARSIAPWSSWRTLRTFVPTRIAPSSKAIWVGSQPGRSSPPSRAARAWASRRSPHSRWYTATRSCTRPGRAPSWPGRCAWNAQHRPGRPGRLRIDAHGRPAAGRPWNAHAAARAAPPRRGALVRHPRHAPQRRPGRGDVRDRLGLNAGAARMWVDGSGAATSASSTRPGDTASPRTWPQRSPRSSRRIGRSS